MYISYDSEADVLFASWGERTTSMRGSRDFGGERWAEFNADDDAIAVEFLSASRGVDLTGIPHANEIEEELRRPSNMIETQVRTGA